MKWFHDTYNAQTLDEAKAAAMQAIDTLENDGFGFARIDAERKANGFTISVSYEVASTDEATG